jgi:hypothetical protein
LDWVFVGGLRNCGWLVSIETLKMPSRLVFGSW